MSATFTEHSVIGQAADLIVEHAHCVGDFTDGERLCALGALSLVVSGSAIPDMNSSSTERRLYLDAVFLLQNHLAEVGDPIYRRAKSVPGWSDRAGQDAVVAAMRAAAAGGETP